MPNPFTLAFGREPASLISRDVQTDEIIGAFTATNPEYQVAMITGVRGSGKTVLLTGIENELRSDSSWIVVDVNPERDILKALAADLSNRKQLFQLFRDAKINLSFLGLGLEIDGEPPITDVVVALDRMLARLTKAGKKVLIAIDEAAPNAEVRTFAHQFQIFMRKNYNVFLLMTGLYENIYDLQNEKTLTFLYRAPKIELTPLNISLVAQRYEQIFEINAATAREMAIETKGYPYAYQLLGYLCYKNSADYLDVMPEYDAYLESYVYQKIWSELSPNDQLVVTAMAGTDSPKVKDVRKAAGMKPNAFSVYRSRLLRKGIVYAQQYGCLSFALPRFREFVLRTTGEMF